MMMTSASKTARVVIGSCALALSALAVTGCTTGAAPSATEQSAVQLPTATASASGETAEPTAADIVTQAEAEQAAVVAVGEGRATWSGPENDLGAAWEVEVTRTDGSEVDVLVAADGSIIDTIERFSVPSRPESARGSGSGTNEASGVIDREQAMRIAVESVGEGQVTWVGREDDRGAAWEVEVTRPDGSEVDVLVDAAGNVIP